MSLKYWLNATRPKTLPAGAIPVIIGSAYAYNDGTLDLFYFGIVLLCSILIQILVNYINEIYDFRKGADNKDRLGPQRAVASGLISEKAMIYVSILLMLITFALGMVIVAKAGWIILTIGLLSLFFSWAYTGGPYPLAYNGLGDVFVLVFFGIAAVNGTYYVFAEHFTFEVFIASLAPGFISMNLLGVNNIRDIDSDRKVGKMTLSAVLGREKSILLHAIISILIYIIPIALFLISNNYFIFLPLISVPFAANNHRNLKKLTGRALNKVLADTGKFLIIYGVLLSIGIINF